MTLLENSLLPLKTLIMIVKICFNLSLPNYDKISESSPLELKKVSCKGVGSPKVCVKFLLTAITSMV